MSDKRWSGAGKFVWHDLMTTDREASVAYYAQLLGWSFEDEQLEGFGSYKMIRSGDKAQGGFVPLDKDQGLPSHWIGYVLVNDVDAATARAAQAGGRVCVPGTDIPSVGRFALVTDPGGGLSSPFRGGDSEETEAEGPPAEGHFCWDELLAVDVEAAAGFYQQLYGWERAQADMGEMGVYHLFRAGDKDRAGMMAKPKQAPGGSVWLPYVSVADVDTKAELAAKLGAVIHVPPSDIPGVGRFSVTSDPQGASLGLLKLAAG
jgi:predicted enzyme related to lactoylglutathione lyase